MSVDLPKLDLKSSSWFVSLIRLPKEFAYLGLVHFRAAQGPGQIKVYANLKRLRPPSTAFPGMSYLFERPEEKRLFIERRSRTAVEHFNKNSHRSEESGFS